MDIQTLKGYETISQVWNALWPFRYSPPVIDSQFVQSSFHLPLAGGSQEKKYVELLISDIEKVSDLYYEELEVPQRRKKDQVGRVVLAFPTLSIVNSSMTGKSRAMFEVARTKNVIYCNLSEDLTAFPKSHAEAVRLFQEANSKLDMEVLVLTTLDTFASCLNNFKECTSSIKRLTCLLYTSPSPRD
eukprot:TRINITY_DN11301_c0_g1_i2.p1 TRINITY_DN11301_c0_g1~~TRINITY_DN11301_c0_g1_i2.p1  ORF type:complete len:187 (-),score=21.22 TRINITY_DN11301_c0_g1_i2:30-590(-)